MLMLSVPAAIITSASPRRMRSAASATACTPEEQKRLMVMPETVFGKARQQQPDARHVHALLRLRHRAADDHVVDRRRVEPGALARAPLFSTCASRSSGRTFLNMPRGALPTGVRVAATM